MVSAENEARRVGGRGVSRRPTLLLTVDDMLALLLLLVGVLLPRLLALIAIGVDDCPSAAFWMLPLQRLTSACEGYECGRESSVRHTGGKTLHINQSAFKLQGKARRWKVAAMQGKTCKR